MTEPGTQLINETSSRIVLKGCGIFALAALLLPFVYLTSVAFLISAYVHDLPFPSRAFLRRYAIPSNRLVALPVIGVVYSNYCQVCIRLSGGDQDSMRTGP